MTSVLEITVFDEDRDHKMEFLGRVVIPLLRIRNGEKRWYALKDKTMFARAKGTSPQVSFDRVMINYNLLNTFAHTMYTHTYLSNECTYLEGFRRFSRTLTYWM